MLFFPTQIIAMNSYVLPHAGGVRTQVCAGACMVPLFALWVDGARPGDEVEDGWMLDVGEGDPKFVVGADDGLLLLHCH